MANDYAVAQNITKFGIFAINQHLSYSRRKFGDNRQFLVLLPKNYNISTLLLTQSPKINFGKAFGFSTSKNCYCRRQ